MRRCPLCRRLILGGLSARISCFVSLLLFTLLTGRCGISFARLARIFITFNSPLALLVNSGIEVSNASFSYLCVVSQFHISACCFLKVTHYKN